MKSMIAAVILLCATSALAAAAPAKHYPSGGTRVSGPTPAYSAAVESEGTHGGPPRFKSLERGSGDVCRVVIPNERRITEIPPTSPVPELTV